MGSTYANEGAGFVTDYSNLAGAGSAFDSFAKAFQNAQDQKVKNQEVQARIAAMQTQQQRDATDQAIKMKSAGLQQSSPGGELTDAPLSPAAQGKQKLDVFKAGGKAETDENGNIKEIGVDPDSLNMMKLQNGLQAKQFSQGLASQRLDLQKNRFGETQSQNASKAGQAIEEDSVMKDMSTARNSLSRGKALLDSKQPLTFNNLNAVQQDVISGMSKGGQSSEGKVNREMQDSWIGHWNDLMAKAGKYGEDNDIRTQDPGLYKQIKGLLNEVDGTIGQNMAQRTKSLSTSYGQTSNQKVKATVDQKLKQYSAPATDPEDQYTPGAPQGLVKKPGMLSKMAGLVTGPQDPAAPKTTFSPDVMKYAQDHRITPEQANAIKIQRTGQ